MKKGSHFTPGQLENLRQAHRTLEAREKNRQAHLGKHRSPESIEKMRQTNLGRHHTPESIEKIRKAHCTPEAIERVRQVHLGRHHSPETVEKIRRANCTPEARERTRRANLGKVRTPEQVERIRKGAERRCEDPKYLKNWHKSNQSKTRPERRLDNLLQSLYPNEFKYNGRYDCGISIGRLIPDFVNVNGKKQVIDVHGSYWHEGEDVKDRQERYAKYGYSSLIIWDYELKDERAVIQRIVEFVGAEPHHYFEAR
jgi:G:T-mismatch repair DNA endonuclease (very short patch repair protein)/DNA-binding TFAR19-related protein (PDSD5 family)